MSDEKVFAGFWVRLMAAILDGILLYLPATLLLMFTIGYGESDKSFQTNMEYWNKAYEQIQTKEQELGRGLTEEEFEYYEKYYSDNEPPVQYYEGGDIILTIYGIIIFALFNSSKWQASPGKRLMNIHVIKTSGDKISFARGVGRELASILSVLILLIGYIMIGFTKEKTGLHDLIANTRVIYGKPGEEA